jgi:hypothetical protein
MVDDALQLQPISLSRILEMRKAKITVEERFINSIPARSGWFWDRGFEMFSSTNHGTA